MHTVFFFKKNGSGFCKLDKWAIALRADFILVINDVMKKDELFSNQIQGKRESLREVNRNKVFFRYCFSSKDWG